MDTQRPKDEEQLEEHSLPGTNMAGKGPEDECESPTDEKSSKELDSVDRLAGGDG